MNTPKLYTSHRDDEHGGGKAPTTAHLALQTAKVGEPDALLPIPEGSHLFFIENPRKADTIVECILEKVIFDNHILKEIRLVAYSKSWKTTRRLHLTAAWSGQHVSALNEEGDKTDAHLKSTKTDIK